MGINTYNYTAMNLNRTLFIDSIRQSMRNNPAFTNELKRDTFVKSSDAVELKELERLFPNGEIYQIYDSISKEYGLINPPELKIINDQTCTDKGLFDAVNNTVTLNLLDLNPSTKKYMLEMEGKKWFNLDESGYTLKTDSNQKIIDQNLKNIKNAGMIGKAVDLTDDDKRKVIIFTLAHELEHCYQHQQMDKTEGISSLNAIKQRCANQMKNVNLIEKYLFMHKLEKDYLIHNKNIPQKQYTQTSEEGRQAIEWYNAKINYTKVNNGYEDYINNPLETDANKRANEYLVKNYGNFQNVPE